MLYAVVIAELIGESWLTKYCKVVAAPIPPNPATHTDAIALKKDIN